MKKYDPKVTPWQVAEQDFPKDGALEEKFKFLLRYAILAPSGHNTQPWKFKLQPDGVFIYADYTRRLPVVDPDDRELVIGTGAAIMNLRVAAAHFGYACEVQHQPKANTPELLASARLFESSQTDTELKKLFPAIVQRRTNRIAYEVRSLAEGELERLQELTSGQKAAICIVADKTIQPSIAELVSQGDLIQMSDPVFRQELASWVRSNWTLRGDGIAAYGFGIPGIISWMGPWFMRTFDLGKPQAKKDYQFAKEAAALIIVHGEDTKESLLEVGEMFERFVLTATSMDLQYAFLNQPVEVRDLRTRLQAILGLADLPQLLFRIGYAEPQKRAMPRRPLDAVLIEFSKTGEKEMAL
ncbi:nitroreductase [Methanophagales archaeon]|nr:MAG: nitroreductase [Methanophagales archaeon]